MSWSKDRYFAKAQKYWSTATSLERETPEFLLNLSFFCEFVVRGCLVNVNPALNAAADEESILYAGGIAPARSPRSIDINVGVGRVAKLVPDITEEETRTVTALFTARNAELHGDLDALGQISNHDLVPKIFSFSVKIFDFCAQDLGVVLGEDADNARKIAEASVKDRKRRVGDLIRVQKERFFSQPESDQIEKRQQAKHDFVSASMRSGHYIKTQKCPVCAESGLLAGLPVGRSAPILRKDGIIEEVRISPELFECKCCELKIRGLDELMSAGFGSEFYVLDDKDVIDHFNIDPMDYVDTDEIIQEYNREMSYQDEYQDE